MPGSATLDDSLIDSLVPVVDVLRDLYRLFGGTQYQVFTVKRTWTGDRRGEGTFSDVESEITPQPLVTDVRGRSLDGAGLDEEGTKVYLRELSLSYTEPELLGPVLNPNEEWLYKIVETRGQLNVVRYYEVGTPAPRTDRLNEVGWILALQRAPGADGDGF